MRQNWPVTAEVKRKAMTWAETVLDDPMANPRAKAAAARHVAQASQINLGVVQTVLKVDHQQEVRREIEETKAAIAELKANPYRHAEDLESIATILNRVARNGDVGEVENDI
jgi:hypothetical protein